jgi:membrane fusion protein, multidrug efflux system
MALRENHHQPVEAEQPGPMPEQSPSLSPQDGQQQGDATQQDASGKNGGGDTRPGAKRRRRLIAVIAVLVGVGAVAYGVRWWLHARQFESTTDAFIAARTVSISPQVAGTVVAVPVTDNERVTAGTELVRIDPRNYQASLQQAKAQREQANASVANLHAQIAAQRAKIDQAQNQVDEAQAALQYARQQNARYQALLKRNAGTQQQAQQAASDLTQKQAALSGAKANATAAEKQLDVLKTQLRSAHAQVDAAKAAVNQADINLERTTVAAPTTGHIANLGVAKGDYVQPGQAMMALVPEDVWVVANFKETALGSLRVGQPVTITVDAYPSKTFHGHVQSIQAGSGTAFSLLPPENATGNFVKVVQRVPVKIVFDRKPDVYLGPGMSVVPSVKVQ